MSEPPAAERSILVAVRAEDNLDALVGLAELLARTRPAREVILARLTAPEAMGAAAALLNRRREELASRGAAARTVAFTSSEPGEDLVRLASEQDTDLLLADGDLTETLEVDLATVLDRAPCDVALLVRKDGAGLGPAPDHPVLVPFGGADHDWAAVEVGAWIARASGASLLLAGAEGDPGLEKRDASRLLASASLLVQRAVGVGDGAAPRAPRAGGTDRRLRHGGLDRRRTVRQVARGRSRRDPSSPLPGTPPARPCSSGGACVRGAWHRARASPASPGRSGPASLEAELSQRALSGLSTAATTVPPWHGGQHSES